MPHSKKNQSAKPNIILITSDQLRPFELGCYGNSVIQTPHIDALAQQSVRFDLAVSNDPVCMPGRSCLMTGQYNRTCRGNRQDRRSVSNYADESGEMPEYPDTERNELLDPTLPEILRENGYHTTLFGKWHIHPAPELIGFNQFLYPRVHHRHSNQYFIENGKEEYQVNDQYSEDFIADRLEAFIKQSHDQPFFAYYNISPPHMPVMDAPEKYRNLYSPEEVVLRPNVWSKDQLASDDNMFKIYNWDFQYYIEHEKHTETLPDGYDLRNLTALHYGLISWVDDLIGQMMGALHESGLLENTIIVFLSDHGDLLGSHQYFNKWRLIEEAYRIPMIYCAPSRWQPVVNSGQVTQIIDVMPTLLNTLNIPVPSHVQGRSVAKILEGEKDALAENYAIIEAGPFPTETHIGIRTPEHLYGVGLEKNLRDPKMEDQIFFNLIEDPYQIQNMINTETEEDLLNNLRTSLLNWNEETPWMQS